MSRSASRHVRQLAPGRYDAYDAAVLAASPVAYWTLGGGSAGVVDRTGNGHNIRYNGYTVTTFQDGVLATLLNGVSQYLEVDHNNRLSVPHTGVLTIEAWLRPDVLDFPAQEGTGYVHWLGKGSPGQHEYVARMYSLTNAENRPNRISGYAFNMTGGLGAGSYVQDPVVPGEWIHYVLVINSVNTNSQYTTGYTKLYRNGAFRDQDALSQYSIIPGTGSAPLRIGTRDFGSFFKGAFAKIAVYDYELSPFAVRDHYQLVKPPVLGSPALVKNVGHASSKVLGNTLAVTVPDTGVSAGSTLIVTVLHDYTSGGPVVIDSRGNTYTRDRTAPGSGNTMRASIFSAPIHAALQPGDSILLGTSTNVVAKVMSVTEFSGLLLHEPLDQINGASGVSALPMPNTAITTTQADELLVGFVSAHGPVDDAYGEDNINQWNTLARTGTAGGDSDSNLTINSAFRAVGVSGQYRYNPALGTSRPWIGMIAAYRAGTPVVVPPLIGSALFVQNVGSASSAVAGTILSVTVPYGGIPAGHTLIVRLVHSHTSGGPTAADSRGNIYTRDRTAPGSSNTMRASIFSCAVTVPLQEGDLITITTPAVTDIRTMSVDEFANVLHPIDIAVHNGTSGVSAEPSITATVSTDNTLLVAMIAKQCSLNDAFAQDTIRQWTGLPRVGTVGDGENLVVAGGYRAASAADSYTYAPILPASMPWVAFMVAYRAY